MKHYTALIVTPCHGHDAPPHLSSVYMDMTMPGVQKPHCDPWLAAILCWTACSRPLASPIPSTVVTASPAHNI